MQCNTQQVLQSNITMQFWSCCLRWGEKLLKRASKGLHSLAVSDANVYTTLAVSDAFLLISEKSHLGHFHSGERGKGCACTHVRGCSSGDRRCGVQLLSGAGKQTLFFCYQDSGNACNLTFLLSHCHATKHRLFGSILRGCVRWHLLFYSLAWVPLPFALLPGFNTCVSKWALCCFVPGVTWAGWTITLESQSGRQFGAITCNI